MSALTVTGDHVRGLLLRLAADNAQPLGGVTISLDGFESLTPVLEGEQGLDPGVDRSALARVVEAVTGTASVVMVRASLRAGIEVQNVVVSSTTDVPALLPALQGVEGLSPRLEQLYAGGDVVLVAGPAAVVRVLRVSDWAWSVHVEDLGRGWATVDAGPGGVPAGS